jgi:tripartite-type tricarboxylate transporter receptor subunit TctC
MRQSGSVQRFTMVACIAAGLMSAGLAEAQANFPVRPIRMVVPGSPATGMDNMGRVVSRAMSEAVGQQVVIDNRAGAGSLIGSGIVASAAPDGYTIGVASTSTIVAPLLQTKPPYDPLKDFTRIALLSSITSILVVAPDVPVKNVQEFIQYARARPGQLNFASIGSGSAAHLTPEIFNRAAGIKAVHVPFKAVANVLTELRASRVHYLMFISPASLPMLADGKLRALVVTSPKRFAGLPDVPTVSEIGLPNAEVGTMIGVVGPPKMPSALVKRLHAEIVGVLKSPDTATQFARYGGEPAVDTNPDKFNAQWVAEHKLYRELLGEIGLKPQ